MRTIICGAGIAGLAAASRLLHHGWDVCIVEEAPGPRPQGYMIDLFGAGYETLSLMGLRSRLHELGRTIDGADFFDHRDRRRATLSYATFKKATKGELVSILRPDLELLLREGVEGAADVRYSTTVDAIEDRPDGATVTLSDGSVHDVDLLLGADGIHSQTRAHLFGPEEDYLHYLGMHTAAFIIDDPEIVRRVDQRMVMLDDVDLLMGLYTTRDAKCAVFLVHRSAQTTLPPDPRAELRDRYHHLGPLARRVLNRCPPPEQIYYDQVAQIVLPRWSRRHTMLLGDAAYAVSLVAAQGASLGITGAYILAERLATASSVPEALNETERRMRPLVADRQAVVRRNATSVFLPSSATRLRMRHWTMSAMGLPGMARLMRTGLVGKHHTSIAELTT